VDKGLDELAKRQFILIDSLPFAMKYSSSQRGSSHYQTLVEESLPFLMEKVSHSAIKYDEDIRAAFAFKLNGFAIMSALPNGLALPTGQVLTLTEDLIAADGSGYTNSERLRQILAL
jgi:hypothetical protein